MDDPKFNGFELVAEPSWGVGRVDATAVLITISHPRLGALTFSLTNARGDAFAAAVRQGLDAPAGVGPVLN